MKIDTNELGKLAQPQLEKRQVIELATKAIKRFLPVYTVNRSAYRKLKLDFLN